jgi:hypothetical protein
MRRARNWKDGKYADDPKYLEAAIKGTEEEYIKTREENRRIALEHLRRFSCFWEEDGVYAAARLADGRYLVTPSEAHTGDAILYVVSGHDILRNVRIPFTVTRTSLHLMALSATDIGPLLPPGIAPIISQYATHYTYTTDGESYQSIDELVAYFFSKSKIKSRFPDGRIIYDDNTLETAWCVVQSATQEEMVESTRSSRYTALPIYSHFFRRFGPPLGIRTYTPADISRADEEKKIGEWRRSLMDPNNTRKFAMMFHPTNGRDVFQPIPPSEKKLTVTLTQHVKEAIRVEWGLYETLDPTSRAQMFAEMYQCMEDDILKICVP